MFRTTKQEWERKKEYLVRSLFEDIPELSPINESPEPSSVEPDEDSDEYESPLPDLIIEKEVKKSYDEPKEFFDKLAKEMRRLYKRDFLNIVEDSSSSLGISEVANENYFQNVKEITPIEKSSERQSLDDITLLRKTCEGSCHVSSEDDEEEFQPSVSSDYQERYRCERVTIKAVVHGISEQEVAEQSHRSTVSKECDTTESAEAIGSVREEDRDHGSDMIEEEQEEDEEEEEKEEEEREKDLAKCTVASEVSTNSNTMDYEEDTPELIRQRQTSAYHDSLTFDELPTCGNDKTISKNVAIDEGSMTISEKSITYSDSGREMDLSEISSTAFDINLTSTPKPKSKLIKRSRKRSTPYSSSSSFHSIKATRSVHLQTSFSDDESESTYMWKNIIVGTPITVYNLCYCRKHVCE